jgi:hypothetical protein
MPREPADVPLREVPSIEAHAPKVVTSLAVKNFFSRGNPPFTC